MERKTPRWESELWSYLSSGDGTNCPMYQSCTIRGDNNINCFSKNLEYFKLIGEFIDEDRIELDSPAIVKYKFFPCPRSGRIFKLLRKLAHRYLKEAGINSPPVPTGLITRAEGDVPIEIRQVPMKAHRGSVWRLNDCWVVQLNSHDSTARQRFTLYHEIFHILAHSKATPVFKKAGRDREGSFNEMLADSFATACLFPKNLVKKTWSEVKDVNQMAAIFEVPRPVAWLASSLMDLI
jgi:hypothetical protein